MKEQLGLRQRILRAESAAEIETLLKEGESFKYASAVTRRGWKHAASQRRVELEHAKRKEAPAVQARKADSR